MSMADDLADLLKPDLVELLNRLPAGAKKHEIHGAIHDWIYDEKKIASLGIEWKAHETYLVVRICPYDMAGTLTQCSVCNSIGVIFEDRYTPQERVVLCPECDGLPSRWKEPSARFKIRYPGHLQPRLVHEPLPEFDFDA